MSDAKPLSDAEIADWECSVKGHSCYPPIIKRMLATIRERDARIAELKHELSERKLGDHYAGYCAAQNDARRAEAFALYCLAIERNEESSLRSDAKDAIRYAAAFNAEWETAQ